MKALALIDLQNDFIDGSLAVGSEKFYKAWENTLKLIESEKFDCVLVTMDFHPQNHCSFKAQGGIWPNHCVQESGGVSLNWKVLNYLNSISQNKISKGEEYPLTLLKGQNQNEEEYGVNLMNSERYISSSDVVNQISEIHIAGLCTDYCVKNCAIETAKANANLPIYLHKSCSVAIDENAKLDLDEFKNIKVVE